jgi:hypothetical protein
MAAARLKLETPSAPGAWLARTARAAALATATGREGSGSSSARALAGGAGPEAPPPQASAKSPTKPVAQSMNLFSWLRCRATSADASLTGTQARKCRILTVPPALP